MTHRSFIFSSAKFYARSHVGLLIGAFLASAILSGSLLVGDSVRASLKRVALLRLGYVRHAMLGGDRWFTERLAQGTGSAPMIIVTGSASLPTGQARANGVQVLGVSEAFWNLSPSGKIIQLPKDGVAVNEVLAAKLSLKVGDTLVVRMEQPSTISRDAPLSGSTKEEVTMRHKVSAIITPVDYGSFQIAATQRDSDTVFLPLAELQSALNREGRINVFARSPTGRPQGDHPLACLCKLCAPPSLKEDAPSVSGRWFNMVLASHTTLDDLALKLTRVAGTSKEWEISTDRIFIDQAFADKLLANVPGSYGVVTYLVNGFSSAAGRVPYSMVSAVNEKRLTAMLPGTELKPQETLVNQWLADDLKLSIGGKLEVRYFTVGAGRELTESTASFTVRGIVPMTNADMKREWTPDFPGVSDADNCRDWNSGLPIKLDAIRDQDEKYWDDFKGTPKAFIGLGEGQKLWANRFGKLTAIRFADTGEDEAALRVKLGSMLRLSDVGLVPIDLRQSADAAAKGTVDFGGLFIGLSLFLIVAALVFAALLFNFMIERRASQVGLLMALGWTQSQVRKAILSEAGVIALVGSALGLLGGVGYTKAALAGLSGAWGGATPGLPLVFDAPVSTLIIAGVASFVVSMITLWWASRRLFAMAPRELISGSDCFSEAVSEVSTPNKKSGLWKRSTAWLTAPVLAIIGFVSAVVLGFAGGQQRSPEAIAGMFFGGGMMLLIGGLALAKVVMRRLSNTHELARSLWQIGVRNVVRRPGRSLAVLGMMAGGIFLVAAVNAFRLSADSDPTRRDSGTGGFAFVGESALPIYEDLNGKLGREAFGLDEEDMQGVSVMPFRVRDGDDASCLNLNKAQTPQIIGVDQKRLIECKAFAFTSGGWEALTSESSTVHNSPSPNEIVSIPGIADMNTAMWGLGKGVGDTLNYKDSAGHEFRVKLVALLEGSVLQGKIIVNEADFIARYPDAAGYRYFLIDAPARRAVEVAKNLSRQLEPRGMALESAAVRFAAFSAVQNTYIGIFTVLGGLGVLLGTAGLGVLVARHVLERKGELGLMLALGFRRPSLRGMIIGEHSALLMGGLMLGTLSALIAVWPSLHGAASDLPWAFMLGLLVSIALFGFAVCGIAATAALRGRLLDAVRRE